MPATKRLGLWPVVRRSLYVALLLGLCCCLDASAANAGDAPLADAAEKADWGRVRALLAEHAEVNASQVDGMTALHWAVYHDETEAAKLLLAAGADAKATNHYGVTPLTLACTNGSESLVKALLAAGADANATLRGGETALMTAARTGRLGPVRELLAAGAKVDACDRKGQTPLMWAAADGHAAVVETLIEAGADPHARLKSGFTPLLFAAREGRIEVVHALLKAGIDANGAIATEKAGGRAPVNGTSALILAVENGHFELALALVDAGANPNDQRSGFTPLHTLTWVRKPNRGDGDDGQPAPTGSGNVTSLECVKELVKRGADVNARLEKGPSGGGKLGMKGATPFLLAARTDDLPYLKLLVELGADPLIPNGEGCTPLMTAAGIGTLAPTEEAGTEPEALETVEYLLTLGGDVNAVDKNGETAMHGAAYKSLPKMVQFLAERGAKIDVWNKKNKYDWTPLLIAEGFRPGNFKPSTDTIAALHSVMRAAGVTPPPPTARPAPAAGYDASDKKR
jgi:ankyrin repeat protein